jgi:hypothetical protein
MLPKIPLLQIGDFKLDQMQKNIINPINDLFKIPFLDGVLLQDVTIKSGANTINHKLNRNYLGFIVTKQNADTNFWITDDSDKNLFLKLNASSDCLIDVWVF